MISEKYLINLLKFLILEISFEILSVINDKKSYQLKIQ